ncbi:MAG TPA: tetratricopeptide repeat protein [Thioalkalivibrio sp.]|nr:tetratricopeptide repeat protein [Thioalkalivibrio sp.]
MRFFFPVFESRGTKTWCAFAGISLPQDYAESFQGLYRVTDLEALHLLPTLCLPPARKDFIYWHPFRNCADDLTHPVPPPMGGPNVTEGLLDAIRTGRGRLAQGDPQGAIQACRQALAVSPRSKDLQVCLAEALEAAGQLDAAADAYQSMLDLSPDFWPAYDRADRLLRQSAAAEERLGIWDAFAQQHPDTVFPHAFCATALERAGEHKRAAVAWRSAIAQRPSSPNLHACLGNALLACGEVTEALDAHRRAVALAPEYPDFYPGLAEALARHGDIEGALEAARDAVERDAVAKNVVLIALDRAAIALEAAGRFDQARETREARAWISINR